MANRAGSENELGALKFGIEAQDLASAQLDAVGAKAEETAAKIGRSQQTQQQFAEAARRSYERLKREAQRLADEEVSSVERAARSLQENYGKQIGLLTSLIGKVTAATGVFALFYRIGEQVSQMLKSGAEQAREFRDALDVSSGAAALAQVEKQIATLQSRLAANQESRIGRVVNWLSGQSSESLRKQLAELEGIRKSFQDQQNARTLRERERTEREAAKREQQAREALFDELERRADDFETRRLQGIARVNAEEERALADIDHLWDQQLSDREKDTLTRLARAIRAEAAARRQEIQEREAAEDAARRDRERKEREAAERIAQAYADAIRSAAQSILSQQQSFFNSQFERMAADISVVRRLIESRGSWRP